MNPSEIAKIKGLYPVVKRISLLRQCKFADEETKQSSIAHAHDNVLSDNFGTICISEGVKLFKNDNRPSTTILHEIAHLIVSKDYHSQFSGHCEYWQDFYNVLRVEWGYSEILNPTTHD